MAKKRPPETAKFRIAHVAAEVEPFSKTGGLGDVLGSLPRAHQELGSEVIIITPFYEKIIDSREYHLESLGEPEKIEVSEGVWEHVAYRRGMLGDSVPVYFVENKKFFGSQKKLYGMANENARFMFFDIAVLHLLKKIDFKPQIIHCHDWHTGLIPYFLKGRYKSDPFFEDTATLFTIHNLAYQLGHDWWAIAPKERDDGHSKLPVFKDSKRLEKINFAKRAILNADAINAVSETYREEIMTKDFGEELQSILKKRQKTVYGIVNGIDYNEFNPLTDSGITQHYSDKSVGLKNQNKKILQKYCQLPPDSRIPLLCMTSRITEQKGFKLIVRGMRTLMSMGVQIIVMGDGNVNITEALQKAQKEFPRQFVLIHFDQEKETLLYAGSDMFLLPSRFEPCGINQLIALRYGCIPIVHHIGGLADTINDYDPWMKSGNGFTFRRYRSIDLLIAVARAIETYKHRRAWRELVITGMQEAHSWLIPALKYLELYETTLRLKKRSERKRENI